jgi:phosphohistidine phosphatase SixA
MVERPRTVILIRHADVDGVAQDQTELNDAGEVRRDELRHVLGDAGIEEILVSPVIRSHQTAQTIADHLDITPREIEGAHLTESVPSVAAAIQGLPTAMGVILVVAHSNTLGSLVTALGGPEIDPIKSFDNLFVLSGGLLTHLRYGAEPLA